MGSPENNHIRSTKMLTTRVPRSSGKFTYSSPKNPCPVCGRTKDKDCRWNEVCHCRTYAKEHLGVGEIIRGDDGRQWAYLGGSDGGRWAMFKLHEERRGDDWDPKLTSFTRRANNKNGNATSAKPTPSQPVAAPSSTRATTVPSTASKAVRPEGQQDFIYCDADGQPVILVRRTDDGQGNKTFQQFRYENGKWVSRLNEHVTKRVRLYRITEARAMSEQTGRPIFLVEGESCVERLLKVGIPATTSIGGAGKWSGYGGPNYLQDLQGCRIILSPDADSHGVAHMLKIERSLRAAGIEVAGWLLAPPDAPWENLPDGGGLDVVDWLESGATVEEILGSIRVALPDYLVADDEIADLAAEVSELAQLDRASGLTLLPKDLDTPLRRIAERPGLPVEAYYLVLLCVAASLLPSQTRLVLDANFKVPPILWGGLVGETGSGKSHIISTLTSPLDTLQAEHSIRYQRRLEEYKAALREYEKERRKSDDAGDPPEKPVPVDLYASDYTMEAVGQILSQQPERGLLISPDELSAFLNSMDAYRKGKGADRARWLSLYNGQSLKINRKTSDQIFVHCTSVSVIGGIQPSVLQTYWREDRSPGDGLWARFAWVKVPIVPRSRARRGATHDPQRLLEAVYRRLQAFPPMRHELDEEGWQLWDKWECEFDEPLLTEPNERIRATLPKTKERAARIALILHYLDAACAGVTPSQVLPASTLARAIEFTRWLQNQTRLIYGELGESSSPEVSLVLRFVGRFRGCGAISLKRCRSWWPTRSKPPMKEIRSFLDGVVQMGYARWVDPQHIEVIQTDSVRHVRHFVTQEPETLVQSDFEPVTKVSSLSSSPTPSFVTSMQDGSTCTPSCTHDRPETTTRTSEIEDRILPTQSEASAVSKAPQPITGGDPTSSKTVEPEPPSLPRQPVDDADSNPQSRQRCGATAHNAGANGQRVRFLDRDPVPPPLRGREAQLERETYRTAVVWVGGKRQRVPKDWLVEGSSTPALEEREPEPPPLSLPPVDDDAPITMQDWKALLAACREAGMLWGTSVELIASTIGIPVGEVNPARVTRRQLQQIMERVKSLRRP
jgi:CRISPR-associated protein Cmr3